MGAAILLFVKTVFVRYYFATILFSDPILPRPLGAVNDRHLLVDFLGNGDIPFSDAANFVRVKFY